MLLAAGLFGPWGSSVLRSCAAFHPSVRTLLVRRRGACLTFFYTNALKCYFGFYFLVVQGVGGKSC